MRAYPCTDVCIMYNVVTKNASAILHQMWRSQVLPRYPHSSAGAYALEQEKLIIHTGTYAGMLS